MANAKRGFTALAACVAVACGGQSGQSISGDTPDDSRRTQTAPLRDAGSDATRTPELPSMIEAARLTLGEFSSGEVIALPIPPDTVGVSLIAEGATGSARFETVKSPTGSLVLSNGLIAGSTSASKPLESTVTTTAIPLHATSDAPLDAGIWSITLNVNGPARWRVRAMIQTIPGGRYRGSALDMHVYIPDGMMMSDPAERHPLRASSASADGSLNFRLNLFFDALKRSFDIDRGTVVFHETPGMNANDPPSTFEHYAFGEPNAQALHVVLSNGTSDVSQSIVPRSPAAIGFSDTNLPHVILAVSTNPAESDVIALLQGFGRAVGMPYTMDGGAEDPYPDTTSCAWPLKQDCADTTNLMFRGLATATPTVAKSQVRVVTSSPLLRAFLSGKDQRVSTTPDSPKLSSNRE